MNVFLARARATPGPPREAGERRGRVAALIAAAGLALRRARALPARLIARRQVPARRDAVRERRAVSVSRHPMMAVALTGGVGDFLVIGRFLRDLAAQAGPIEIDLFCPTPEVAAWALAGVPGIGRSCHDIMFDPLLGEYDVALRINQFAVVYQDFLRWDVLRERPRLVGVIRDLIRYRGRTDVLVREHPHMDNFLARTAVFAGCTRRDFLHHIAGIPFGGDRLTVPLDDGMACEIGLTGTPYVTVHNGFDTGFAINGRRATKCYPHFGAVVRILRASFPAVRFVQIGTATSEPIEACDVNLVGRTSLPQAAGVLAGATFHIDNESGLVHLARCYGVPAGVVFGPTPSDFFGYPDNVNIDPPVCGGCWWMTRTWMDSCAKQYESPRCMTEQDPAVVAERLTAALRGLPALRDAAGPATLRPLIAGAAEQAVPAFRPD